MQAVGTGLKRFAARQSGHYALPGMLSFNIAEAVWLFTLAQQALLCVLLVRGRHHRQVPVFFVYNVFHVILSAALWFIRDGEYRIYFFSYWIGEMAGIVLGLLVVGELFRVSLLRYPAIRSFTSWISLAVVGLLVGYVWFAVSRKHVDDSNLLVSLALFTERSFRIAQAALLLTFLALLRVFKLELSIMLKAIFAGFSAYVVVGLALLFASTVLGPDFMQMFIKGKPFIYLLVLFAWIAATLVPEGAQAFDEEDSEQLLRWERYLQRYAE